MQRQAEHEAMVSQLLSYCIATYGDHAQVSYALDTVGLGSDNRPPKVGNSRPDVYGKRPSDGIELIGEAKTKGDLENIHTERQVADYAGYVENRHSILLIIVPWPLTRACKSLVLRVCPEFHSWPTKLVILPGGSM